jgi:hypothetical protein
MSLAKKRVYFIKKIEGPQKNAFMKRDEARKI